MRARTDTENTGKSMLSDLKCTLLSCSQSGQFSIIYKPIKLNKNSLDYMKLLTIVSSNEINI